MLGRAGGQPKVFAQRRRRANRTAASTTTQPLRALHRSPIASATLVQAAKSMDARNIRARRTAVITDFSLTRSWDFFLEIGSPLRGS
jgi:hypothetical protein